MKRYLVFIALLAVLIIAAPAIVKDITVAKVISDPAEAIETVMANLIPADSGPLGITAVSTQGIVEVEDTKMMIWSQEALWMREDVFLAGQIDRTLYRKGMVDEQWAVRASGRFCGADPSPTSSVVTEIRLLMLSATAPEDFGAYTAYTADPKTAHTVDAIAFLA